MGWSARTETLYTVFGAAITEQLLVVALVVGLLAYELLAGFRQSADRSDGAA